MIRIRFFGPRELNHRYFSGARFAKKGAEVHRGLSVSTISIAMREAKMLTYIAEKGTWSEPEGLLVPTRAKRSGYIGSQRQRGLHNEV